MRPEKPRVSPLGRYLANRRQELGYSVTDLGVMAQVPPSGVSDLELGKRPLTGPMARKLAGPLGVTPNELFMRASITLELPWDMALPSDTEQNINLELNVTDQEAHEVREYLRFVRFRRWFSISTE